MSALFQPDRRACSYCDKPGDVEQGALCPMTDGYGRVDWHADCSAVAMANDPAGAARVVAKRAPLCDDARGAP